MKLVKSFRLVTLALALAVVATACRNNPDKGITPIFGRGAKPPGGSTPGGPIDPGKGSGVTDPGVTGQPIQPTSDLGGFDGMGTDRTIFAADTVYFEFDRHVVKAGEKKKIENVASYLKSHPDHKVLVEGHCDERGTEEYNRSLGEKRALALREAMIKLGVAPDRIRTLSFGEDKPADPGHNDTAFAKNRRGEFVLLIPKN